MVKKLKRFYGAFYFLGNAAVFLHSMVEAALLGGDDGYWGAALATFLGVVFFVRSTLLKRVARTRRALPSIAVGGAAGLALTGVLSEGALLPWAYALGMGVVGGQLYTWWYSALGRPACRPFRVGQELPVFSFVDQHGATHRTLEMREEASLFVFFRGNWCPFCTAQIRELVERYELLVSRGVKLYFVSPQPASETRELAARFSVPITFGIDEGGAIAQQLGLWHSEGIPLGVESSFGVDTVYPTVLIADAEGKIVYENVADNYRVRPEPDALLRELEIGTAHAQQARSPSPRATA